MDYSTLSYFASQVLSKVTSYGVFILTPTLLLALVNLKALPLAWHLSCPKILRSKNIIHAAYSLFYFDS
jgi:hypothetical protein